MTWNILFCGFLEKDCNNISLLGKKNNKQTNNEKPTTLPQTYFFMAVLILQTEDHVLTEHSNDTRVPNILWLKQNPKDLRKCPSTVTDSIKNADIQLCNSWGKFSKEWSILHTSTLAKLFEKKSLNDY